METNALTLTNGSETFTLRVNPRLVPPGPHNPVLTGFDKNGSRYNLCRVGEACEHSQAPDGADVWHDDANTETFWLVGKRQ